MSPRAFRFMFFAVLALLAAAIAVSLVLFMPGVELVAGFEFVLIVFLWPGKSPQAVSGFKKSAVVLSPIVPLAVLTLHILLGRTTSLYAALGIVAVSLLSVFALATFRVWQPDWPRPRPAPTTPLARFADNNTAMGLVLIGGGCFLLFMFLGDHSYVNSLGFAAMAFVTGALTLKSPAASKMDERQKAAMRAFTRVGLPFTAAYMFGRFALGFIAPWPAILAADLSFALMATLAAIWYYSQLKHS